MHNTSRVQSTINNQSSRGRDSRPPQGLALWLHFRPRENMSEAHISGSFAPYAINRLPSRYLKQHRRLMKQNSFKVIRCCFKYLRVNDRVAVRGLASPFDTYLQVFGSRWICWVVQCLLCVGALLTPLWGGSIKGVQGGIAPFCDFWKFIHRHLVNIGIYIGFKYRVNIELLVIIWIN